MQNIQMGNGLILSTTYRSTDKVRICVNTQLKSSDKKTIKIKCMQLHIEKQFC